MGRSIKFLIIDDDEDDREFFEIALEDANADATCYKAKSCIDALRLLESKEIDPDYIFLDLNMPQVSGRDCLLRLKDSPLLKDIPVIIFSTSNQNHDIEETKHMGAFSFFTKPPKIGDLSDKLSEFINTHAEKK